MTTREDLGRLLASAGLAPRWARRALRDEESTRLLIAFSLKADSNCIDVGSHEGRVLAEIVRCAPHGRHIAYEPLPHLAKRLASTFRGVEVRAAALSNQEGVSDFVHVRNLPAYSGLRRRSYPSSPKIDIIKVRTERLDDQLSNDYVPAFIKVDVEGAEKLVIEGALKTITRHRPIVLFEHGKGASDKYDSSPAELFELICGVARLRMFDLDGNGPYSLNQFEMAYNRNERWNFVAHA